MKLLATVVLMLVVATLVADAWLVKRRYRSRFVRRFHRRVIKHKPQSSSSSSKIGRRCHILCQKEPLRTHLIKKICPDLCDFVVCQNSGTCNSGVCTCVEGFVGQFCEEIENPCLPTKFCETSAMMCNAGSFSSASCLVQNGQDRTGLCCNDPCEDVYCLNGGTCNSNGLCECVDGFIGNICQDIENPCDSPKFCETSAMMCNAGSFLSASCSVSSVQGLAVFTTSSERTGLCCNDPCDNVVCLNGGTCDSSNGECTCADDFEGEFCADMIDPCDTVVCNNGGSCDSSNGQCTCAMGFEGEFCDDEVDPCATVVCENDGTCNALNGECECVDGFIGNMCQEIENPCDSPKFCETSAMMCNADSFSSASCLVQNGPATTAPPDGDMTISTIERTGNCCVLSTLEP